MSEKHNFLTLVLIVSFISYSAESEFRIAKVGESCTRDHHCIENAFCRFQLTCLCEQFYAPSPDKSMCIATSGLSCNDDSTCRTMANARCVQGVCACKETFILDINNSSNCISRPTKVGDRCQRNDECEEVLGRAMCIKENCTCITRYHFTSITGTCIQSRGLYNACTNDYECFLDEKNPNALRCKDGECVCKEGEPACSKGSTMTLVTIPTILSLVFLWMI